MSVSSRRLYRCTVASGAVVCAALLASCTGPKGTAPTSGGSAIQAPAAPAAPPADVLSKFENPRKPSGPLRFQIISNAITPFWDPMKVGMERQAKEMGVAATWAGPSKSDVGQQRRLLEDAVSKGVDGIAVSCVDPDALKPVINDLMSRTNPPLPIITIDSDSPGSNRLAYIGTNNFEAGRRAGEAATKLLPQGGDVVAFVGYKGAANARERIDGFRSAAEPKGIKVIQVMEDQTDVTKARKNVEDIISKYGDKVKGFLGIYSYNGPAIASAVTAANKRAQYKVMCFDSEPSTIEALQKSNVDFTIVQNPYKFGTLAVQMLTLINRKGLSEAKKEMSIPDNYVIDTGVQVVTPENVGAFLAELQKMGIKSS
jgi:ribose transport system substrate-binding protein